MPLFHFLILETLATGLVRSYFARNPLDLAVHIRNRVQASVVSWEESHWACGFPFYR
jgi:hypothetical protein